MATSSVTLIDFKNAFFSQDYETAHQLAANTPGFVLTPALGEEFSTDPMVKKSAVAQLNLALLITRSNDFNTKPVEQTITDHLATFSSQQSHANYFMYYAVRIRQIETINQADAIQEQIRIYKLFSAMEFSLPDAYRWSCQKYSSLNDQLQSSIASVLFSGMFSTSPPRNQHSYNMEIFRENKKNLFSKTNTDAENFWQDFERAIEHGLTDTKTSDSNYSESMTPVRYSRARGSEATNPNNYRVGNVMDYCTPTRPTDAAKNRPLWEMAFGNTKAESQKNPGPGLKLPIDLSGARELRF